MQDEPYIDYHEVFPTKWEISAAYAICCAKCHETKPAKYFRRRLTRAQAAARGYVGMRNQENLPRAMRGERPMTVESKFCTKCQPGHYKPSEMSENDIYRAAYDGKVSLTRARTDAENKRKRASEKIGQASADRWAKWYAAPWMHIRDKLDEEIRYVTRSINYFEKRTDDRAEASESIDYYDVVRGERSAEARGMQAFFRELKVMLQGARARCKLNARTQAKADDTLTWGNLLGATQTYRIRQLWDETSLRQRARMHRIPAVVNIALRETPLLADMPQTRKL